MSSTTDVAGETVDTRTEAQKLYDKTDEQFESTPNGEDIDILIDRTAGLAHAVHAEVAELREQINTVERKHDLLLEVVEKTAAVIDLISKHVESIQECVDDLLADVPASDKAVRVRRNYSPPTKDRGWNCEHTIEATYPIDAIDWAQIAEQDRQAYEAVEAECIRRDEAEGRTRRYFA